MLKLLYILFALCISTCTPTNENRVKGEKGPIRIPGEFEEQSKIWLGYKTSDIREYAYDSLITMNLITELNPHINLCLLVEHDSLLNNDKSYFHELGLDTLKIEIIIQSPTSAWYRDPGPIFGFNSDQKLVIADFKYTNYENVRPELISQKAKEQESIDRDIAKRLSIPTKTSLVAMEGGGFETNGKGTLIQCEQFTLKRNPHLNKEEIEADFRDNFGIINVIWLPFGLADDPQSYKQISKNLYGFGTGGHTDEFVRFANDSTILFSWIEESEINMHELHKLNSDILSKNFEILSRSRNTNGQPFNIIKIPHPEPETKEIKDNKLEVAVASYLNYLISNEIVIIPAYWEPGKSEKTKQKDDKVFEIFKNLYPNRKVVQINPLSLNWNGGGMHCRYQPQPKVTP